MGHSYRNSRQIQDFWPDDTADTIYIPSSEGVSGEELLRQIGEKWPGIKSEEFSVAAEQIHTRCVTHDRHDPSDFTNFLVITADSEYFKRIEHEGA